MGGRTSIGRGVIEASIESGARITVSSSSQHSADSAVSEIKTLYPSADIAGLKCDLSKITVEEDLEALFNEAGPVDHIVFTAADVLALGVAVRHLPKSSESSLTLTMGSIADHPAPNWALVAFLATGLMGLTCNLALDLKPGRVNAVKPGFVNTGLWDAHMMQDEKLAMMEGIGKKMPVGKAGQVEDVAEAYLHVVKDKNCTGEIIKTRSGQQLFYMPDKIK
ncbi:uncharacterized protein BCR38DRAFT_456069 [Pseudomassariella vexata]|uniref:NAD(P)-binding protein n=1 Tax=Pseudomassariella vexata TaxID=1141098 RepID=A0A1Y2E6V7_9PEZI|nr:uncharacterized protein BCR38DRAFT_456069 [Pseudomassariella vexata]ORY67249.1 hypothetical protein BCR38DRAFT_456069 [Pseudomassariella vexata]